MQRSDSVRIFRGVEALDSLDWRIIDTRDCYSREYKHKKAAEVLVPNRVSPRLIRRVAVFNAEVGENLDQCSRKLLGRVSREIARKLDVGEGTLAPICVEPDLYY